jgi:hypothetical protein
MLECISDFSCWENTIAKLAPIDTATIALIAAIIALSAIWARMHIARRRASIDFLLKTETDRTAIELYDKFKEKAPKITTVPDPSDARRRDYNDIRSWLNICELIAVGVNKGAFSKSISFDYWGDVIPRSYQTAERLIHDIRNNPEEGSQHTCVELEKLATRWAEGAGGGMRVRRGFFRLWIVGTALFVFAIAFISYNDIKAQFDAVPSKPEVTSSFIAEFRQQYPEYNNLTDAQLLDTVYKKFYSGMPREEFEKQVSEQISASNKIVKFQGQVHEFPADFTDEEIATALKRTIKNPWASVGEAAAIAFGIPLAVLILGASLIWAFSGFAEP